MKRLFYLMLVVLGTMAFVSCSDDDENNGGEIDEPIERPVYHYGEITMVQQNGDELRMTVCTFNVGDTLTIDYGDGYIQKNAIAANETSVSDDEGNRIKRGRLDITYGYSESEKHTITIKGNISNLYCPGNQLTSLDVSGCTALTELECYSNELTALDVSKNTALTYLNCYDNELTALDASKNMTLTSLSCEYNQLTSLNVNGCTALTYLSCSENQLTSLDISKNTALTSLYCYNNQFTAAEMNKIYEALPTVEDGDLNCDQLGNPGIAEQKGWEVSFK